MANLKLGSVWRMLPWKGRSEIHPELYMTSAGLRREAALSSGHGMLGFWATDRTERI